MKTAQDIAKLIVGASYGVLIMVAVCQFQYKLPTEPLYVDSVGKPKQNGFYVNASPSVRESTQRYATELERVKNARL